uniref:methionine aminopeptidase 1 isoform X1 n=1 Tax=Myxine glutinosa TaxID=7769 RepID=UPI00359015D8
MASIQSQVCETEGCSNASKLQCPTCIKLGVQSSFFCSQECFKGSWDVHKQVHKKAKEIKARKEEAKSVFNAVVSDPFFNYHYTGLVRPWYPLSPKREVPCHIIRPDYATHPQGISRTEREVRGSTQIKVLAPEEIEGMRIACRLGREVLDIAARMIRPGVTTDAIDNVVHEACVERNCYPSPLNYYSFPKSCCTSVNEVICHGIPDQRPLLDGDIINVDITVYHGGFHGDLNETFFVGTVNEASKKLVRVAYESLMLAIAEVKPGTRYRDVGNVIQKHTQMHGFSVVRSYCGHGIHRLFHTAPNVPHYAKNKAIGVMKSGHVFTIEPMISEGTWQDETWPDLWTAVTKDGRRSAQFEHTLLVTDVGCDILTRRSDADGLPHFLTQS